jgi:hypothetical protein
LQERPFLFNDSLFLIIAQGLLERTQNRYGVAGGSATQIARDASGLVNGCLDLLRACHVLTRKRHGAKEVEIGNLPSSDLEMLYWRREKFERDWGSIFAPSIVAAQRDRSDYLRMLLSKDFRRALQSDRVEDLARAIGERIVTLKSEKLESFALWELFLQHRANEQLTAISARAFDYYLCDNDGTLLRELRPTVRVNEALPISLSEDHDFRLVLAPAYLSSGVVVCVASFLRSSVSPRRYVSFTWLHRTDPLTISRELLTVLLVVPDMPSTVAMSVFTDLQRDDVVVSLDGASKELMARCSPNVEDIDTREFFQLRRGRATVYADLQLLEGSELQASLTVDVESLTSHVYSSLLHAMANTIEVPITMEYLRRVLDPVCRFLEIDLTSEGCSNLENSPTRSYGAEPKKRA